jgi:uncharacterized small protein (DUF1192 family)
MAIPKCHPKASLVTPQDETKLSHMHCQRQEDAKIYIDVGRSKSPEELRKDVESLGAAKTGFENKRQESLILLGARQGVHERTWVGKGLDHLYFALAGGAGATLTFGALVPMFRDATDRSKVSTQLGKYYGAKYKAQELKGLKGACAADPQVQAALQEAVEKRWQSLVKMARNLGLGISGIIALEVFLGNAAAPGTTIDVPALREKLDSDLPEKDAYEAMLEIYHELSATVPELQKDITAIEAEIARLDREKMAKEMDRPAAELEDKDIIEWSKDKVEASKTFVGMLKEHGTQVAVGAGAAGLGFGVGSPILEAVYRESTHNFMKSRGTDLRRTAKQEVASLIAGIAACKEAPVVSEKPEPIVVPVRIPVTFPLGYRTILQYEPKQIIVSRPQMGDFAELAASGAGAVWALRGAASSLVSLTRVSQLTPVAAGGAALLNGEEASAAIPEAELTVDNCKEENGCKNIVVGEEVEACTPSEEDPSCIPLSDEEIKALQEVAEITEKAATAVQAGVKSAATFFGF